MARSPDLSDLSVPKDEDAAPAPAPAGTARTAYAHTLSLRLSAPEYRRLRRYVTDIGEKTGKRVTHQAIIEAALDDYLKARGA